MPHNPHFRRDVEVSPSSSSLEQQPSSPRLLAADAKNNDPAIGGNDHGFEPKQYSKLHRTARLFLPFVYGGVASCVAEAATFPIDTAKTRLQLQGQATDMRHSSTPYRGM